MAQEVFNEAVVNEYVGLGLAEKVNPTTLKGSSGNKVRLENIVEDDKTLGIKVFTNGLLISSLRFSERGFSDKLYDTMKSELGL